MEGRSIKLNHKEFLLFSLNVIVMIIAIIIYVTDISNKIVSIMSIVSAIVVVITFKVFHKNILSFGFVFVLYNMVIHYGFGIVYFLLSPEAAKKAYASWTISFLNSPNYSLAVLISILAFEMFTILWILGFKSYNVIGSQNDECYFHNNNAFYFAGIIMLLITLVFFVVCLATGVFSLNSSYQDYRAALTDSNQLYNYVLILYATGLTYIVAASDGTKLKVGIIIFSMSAIILLLTGNKGEVFYAVLAALGIMGYKKYKMSPKMVALIVLIVFFVIPIVTATRSAGVLNNLQEIKGDLYGPIMEMGMQIRCVVYSLDKVADGTYNYMYGYSYIRPVLRLIGFLIIPLRNIKDIPIDFNVDFSGMGFTQVAESYLNFGILGSLVIFGALGLIFGRKEGKVLTNSKLCLYGSILVILINMSRNTFIFVPGQMFLMILFYMIINYFSKNKRT